MYVGLATPEVCTARARQRGRSEPIVQFIDGGVKIPFEELIMPRMESRMANLDRIRRSLEEVRADMSRRTVWITIALIGGTLLILFCWDYLWINLIQSGSIDAP